MQVVVIIKKTTQKKLNSIFKMKKKSYKAWVKIVTEIVWKKKKNKRKRVWEKSI